MRAKPLAVDYVVWGPVAAMLARRRHLAWVAFALVSAAAGCQQVPGDTYDGNEDDGWLKPDIPPWGDEDPDTGPSEAETSGPGEPKLDTLPNNPLAECSVVDLLFVIDNSGSMLVEQQHLIASFDGFIAGIQDNLDEANDYHIGVVTTDAYSLNVAECQTLGALVTESADGVCGPWTAGRYISLADDLESAFTCAAQVGGTGASDEHQVEAALRAISPELGAPGQCNEGFIRDDALLVLVIITDEDDDHGSLGEPDDWFADIVARKGVESNVVTLTLAGISPPNLCDPDVPFGDAVPADRIHEFTQMFTYGRSGDVCADDYAPFFDASLEIIHDACVNFTPEG
jgi:hypothetical protein